MIQFQCTACGHPMTASPEFAGKTGPCPRCRKPVTVPAPGAPPWPAQPAARPPTPPQVPQPPLPPQPLGRPGVPQPPVAPARPTIVPPAVPPPPPSQQPAGPLTQPFDRRALVAEAAARAGRPSATQAAPAPPAAAGAPRLEAVHGPQGILGKVYPLPAGRRASVGRDASCDVVVASERISRRHCALEQLPDGGWCVEDLGSSNGTLLNQQRIDGKRALRPGDYIQAGDCLFRFSV